MSVVVDAVVSSAVSTFIEKALSEALKLILTSKWKNETEIGKEVLEKFNDEDTIRKFSEKITRDILTFRSLSNAGQNVLLNEVYYPLTLQVQDSGDFIQINDGVILPHRGVIVISGSAGQGKTTILRKLFLEEIKTKNSLPIFINLRDVRFDYDISPVKLVKGFFEGYGIESTDDEISLLMQSSKVVIFFDGFDEVLESYRLRARDIIKESWYRYNCRSIVTTRPHTEIYREPGLKNIQVQKLKVNELDSIIERVVSEESQKAAILKLIKSKDFLRDALIYPIMVELLLVSYYTMREAPQTIADFYDQLFRNLMYSHDHLKNFERNRLSKLNISDLEKVFNAFCAFTFFQDRYQFNEKQLDTSFSTCLQLVSTAKEKRYNSSEIRSDIVEGTNLISRDGSDFYTFIHKSIQEYHAAKFHIEAEGKQKYIKDLISDNDSAQINFLRFLYQISLQDFLLLYVRPYMKSLGFIRDFSLNNGYSKQCIVNKLLVNSSIEFISTNGKVSAKHINVKIDNDRLIRNYHRMRFLVGILNEFFQPEMENRYLSKISLRRNPFINATNFSTMLTTKQININDFSPACLIQDKDSIEKRILFNGSLSLVKEKVRDVTYIDDDFAEYTDMLNYLKDFYQEHIMPFFQSKKRSRLRNLSII
ncbi:TPA: NACHT domain-containing protein [Enterobacter asburiae]|nr:NACHT domain-containing protein [Enterobacter asburiae]